MQERSRNAHVDHGAQSRLGAPSAGLESAGVAKAGSHDCDTDRDLRAAALEETYAGISGVRCCAPTEEGYDEARRIWNGAIDRYPALIARCAGADDVVTAVRFARERDLLISVRGGGHAVAGHAVCDGGVMIDLSLMKAIESTRWPAPCARLAECSGVSSTVPPSGTGWPPPAASSATPASAA